MKPLALSLELFSLPSNSDVEGIIFTLFTLLQHSMLFKYISCFSDKELHVFVHTQQLWDSARQIVLCAL